MKMNCRQLFRLRPLQAMQQFARQPARTETTGTIIPEPVSGEAYGLEKTVNQVTLLGRVGGEPQKRGTEKNPVVIFSVATHVNFKQADTGDLMQKTEWHRICVFKPQLREVAYKFVRKGQRIYINGRITYGEIKDQDGNIRSTTAITAEDMVFLQEGKRDD
ncbi:hypothetical protein B566_EDAN004540 [Ephemera danica]|nr:hypothetical protein B566_EDAN004540 [Ephemera danica]